MNRATPRMQEVSNALLAYATSANETFIGEASPASAIIEKLRPHLANLMGIGGFRALLLRALVLAKEEVSWLRDVQVSAAGTLEGLERQVAPSRETEFLDGNVIILAQLLGLLVDFIGMALTLQQLKEVWPDFSVTVSASANDEVQSEKANQAGQ